MLIYKQKRDYHRGKNYRNVFMADDFSKFLIFHESCCRCFKHFYLEKVCEHLRYLFPKKPCINVQRTIETQLALC